MILLQLLDLALLIFVTLRLTRFVTTDSLGQWWIIGPLTKQAYGKGEKKAWSKYLDGLTCPFCVGFWIGCVALLSLYLVGGPGEADLWWRYAAGAFALNWVVGHVSAYLD